MELLTDRLLNLPASGLPQLALFTSSNFSFSFRPGAQAPGSYLGNSHVQILVITLLLFTSSLSHARQYIQCAHDNSWDRVVINLQGEKSTLFMTDGVHNPHEIRILKPLFFVDNDGSVAAYETNQGKVKEVVLIPAAKLGVPSRLFEVIMRMQSHSGDHYAEFKLGCFSAIYPD
jgi:hypothetical protein